MWLDFKMPIQTPREISIEFGVKLYVLHIMSGLMFVNCVYCSYVDFAPAPNAKNGRYKICLVFLVLRNWIVNMGKGRGPHDRWQTGFYICKIRLYWQTNPVEGRINCISDWNAKHKSSSLSFCFFDAVVVVCFVSQHTLYVFILRDMFKWHNGIIYVWICLVCHNKCMGEAIR